VLFRSVIGHEGDGANILQTKFATLKLYTPQPLPTGTTLLIHASPAETQPAPLLTPLTSGMQTITDLTQDWQHVGEAVNSLQATNPALAADVLQQMPMIGPKLANGLLLFMAAIKGGDTAHWLGPRLMERLKQSAPDLLIRFESEITQMQQLFINSPLNQWSGLVLPMLFGNEMQQARFYLRKEEEKKNGEDSTRNQRFIIEVDMSQIGDLQFDGFIRSHDRNKSFDLVIRSSKPLNNEVSQGIRDIFDNAVQVTGLKGQLAFQQGSQHFVRPLADQQPPRAGESPNTILA